MPRDYIIEEGRPIVGSSVETYMEQELVNGHKHRPETTTTPEPVQKLSDTVRPSMINEDFEKARRELSPPPATETSKPGAPTAKPEVAETAEPDENSGFWGLLRAASQDVGKGFMEAPRAILGGIRDAGQAAIDVVYKGGEMVREKTKDFPDWFNKSVVYDNGTLRIMDGAPPKAALPDVKAPESTTGGMIRGITEFATAMMPISSGMKAAGLANNFIRSMSAGAVADVVVTREGDQRLSDLIQANPALQNPVTDYLSSKPDDTLAETKFKTAVEGLALGAGSELLLGGLRMLKNAHAAPTVGQLVIDDGVKQMQQPLTDFLTAAKAANNAVPDNIKARIAPQIERLEALPAKLMEMRKAGIPTAEIINEMEHDTRNAMMGIAGLSKRYAGDMGADIEKLAAKLDDTLKNTVSNAGEFASAAHRSAAFENKLQGLVGDPNASLMDAAGNINMSHIDVDGDVKRIMQEMASEPSIQAASRGVQTNKITQELAEQLDLTVPELLARRSGQAMNAEELLAARNLMSSSATKLRDLAKMVSEGGGDAEKLALYRQIAVHRAIQGEISGATAEAGRALQQFNIAAKQTAGDIKAINQFVQSLEQGEVGIEKIAATISMMDDPAAVAKFLSKPEKLSTIEAFVQWRTACLLTSPKTHVVNMLSNSLNTLWQIPERALASHMKPLNPGDLVQKGEWTALAKGSVDGFIDAMRLAKSWDFWKAGGVRHEVQTFTHNRQITRESYPALGIVSDYLGKYASLPMKALGAEDEFFKTIGYRAEMHAQAYRRAASEGLKGEAMAGRIADLMADPDALMKGQAQDFARYITFQQDLEGVYKGAAQWVNSSPWMRLVVPFVKTPTNIWLETVERSPLAPLTTAYKKAIQAGGAEAQIAMARHKMGTGVMAAMGMLTAAGYMSGGGPVDKNERIGKQSTGWQPYSFKVGDQWVSYNRLEPLSGVMALAADGIDIISNIDDAKEADDIVRDLGLVLGHYLDDRTYFKGVAEMLDAIFNPNRAQNIMELAVKTAVSAVPPGQAGQWANQQIDPIMRDARGWLDQIMAKTPGLGKHVPPRRDVWGKEVRVKPALGPDALSPLAMSAEKGDALSQMILDSGLEVSMPKRAMTFGGHGDEGIQLSPDQYDAFVKIAGESAHKHLSVAASGMKNAPKEVQQLMLNKVMSGYRSMAKQQIYNMFPDLKEKVDNRRREYQESLRRK